MRACRTIQVICIASLLAAAFLPAAGERFTSQSGADHNGASQFLISTSGPTSALYARLRNPQPDFRELRLASTLLDVAGLQGNFNWWLFGRPASGKESANATFADASLLSLHCLLVV